MCTIEDCALLLVDCRIVGNDEGTPGVVHIEPTLAAHHDQSASSTAQSLVAGLQIDSSLAAVQHSTSQLTLEVPSSSPTIRQSTSSSAQSSIVHMGPSSPAVQQSTSSTAQLSPGVPSSFPTIRQSTSSSAQSSIVHMGPSSPAVQQSTSSTAQLSPGVPSPI